MRVRHEPHRRRRTQTATVHAARRGESGAALILALVFLTVIGVITGALLGMAYTGTKSLAAYRLERTRRYAADSALQATVFRLSKQTNATLGTTTAMAQCGRLPVSQLASSGGGAVDVVNNPATAYVTVWCQATPVIPGETDDSFDTDGGQAPRRVSMEVRCGYDTAMVVDKKLNCGAGSQYSVIGRARVRFEVDYDNSGAVNKNTRAIVPKILAWQLRI